MAEQQTATIVANYLSTVESNSESENDDYDSVIEEDFDGNEAGSEVEATASDEHDKHTAEKDSLVIVKMAIDFLKVAVLCLNYSLRKVPLQKFGANLASGMKAE